MSEEKANKIYDLLVSIGGASETMRNAFIYHHSKDKDICEEWRFCGKLGFGGKYRSRYNAVDCYSEDETKERLKIITKLNLELSKIVLFIMVFYGFVLYL